MQDTTHPLHPYYWTAAHVRHEAEWLALQHAYGDPHALDKLRELARAVTTDPEKEDAK